MTLKSILCFQQICRIRGQSAKGDQRLVLDRGQNIFNNADPLFLPVCVEALRKINPPTLPFFSQGIMGILFPARPNPIMETTL